MPIGASRIFHVNVNCSDLSASLAFYRDLLGLHPLTRTTPASPQPGAAFGLDEVQWDAWILRGQDPGGVVLDLLEWKVPPPEGTPATDPTTAGLNRLAITCTDLDAAHQHLVAAGVRCRSEPSTLDLGGGAAARLLVCADPDGTQIELVSGDGPGLSHVVVNCADLDASRRYYEELLGLSPVRAFAPRRQSGRVLGIDGEIELRAELLRDPGSGFMVELVEWADPAPGVGRPRRANELGLFRMAWQTDDIDRDYEALLAGGISCYSPPAQLDMGPGLPQVTALFWDDPDGACLELIESPG